MKALIFDTSSLISFAMNGLLPELVKLKKSFKGKFIITKDVKREAIDRPMTIKRFELQAMQLKKLFEDKVLELPSKLDVPNDLISENANDMMGIANRIFYEKNRNLEIVQIGEASCVALSNILTQRKIENVVAMDERTTRMLCEKSENLKDLLERKLHTKITLKKGLRKFIPECKIIRSSELVYTIYKKGLMKIKGKNVLDALLYAVKYKGCAISEKEISEIKSIGKNP